MRKALSPTMESTLTGCPMANTSFLWPSMVAV